MSAAVNYPLAYGLILAVPVLANFADLRRAAPGFLRWPARCELRSWGERLSFAALLFVVITHWFAMLKPEASADGMAMHLAIPINIATFHLGRASQGGDAICLVSVDEDVPEAVLSMVRTLPLVVQATSLAF